MAWGDDFDAFEARMRKVGWPNWLAYDVRTMYQGYVERGFAPTQTERDRLTALLGHPPRTYEAHAEELASKWSTPKREARASAA